MDDKKKLSKYCLKELTTIFLLLICNCRGKTIIITTLKNDFETWADKCNGRQK